MIGIWIWLHMKTSSSSCRNSNGPVDEDEPVEVDKSVIKMCQVDYK